ncbi:hypothetical protein BDV96DRAFT_620674 [Lophiotrema nucula]|uniref:Uncharacterized protein n=1 Tax=Lophiotrema nucula TaxID=690887 RepID=A0A6A5ZFW0_9PLEO|nr:hypothetical protein BDV96DRAFT_620674 [Lophiotrema nucula]
MPYVPTRILQNDTLLYVFQPSAGSSSQFELGSIDTSSKIVASALPYTTLYPTLPFLDSKTQRAFTPVLDDGGNITVYTGDCAEGVGGAELWTFIPSSASNDGNGNWQQQDIVSKGNYTSAAGSNFLSNGMSFSSVVDGDAIDTGAYFFGGMCPLLDNSDDWQSAANYSNLMVTLEPSQADSKSISYQLGVSTSRGPPIAEAGFTLTGLQPSFSNRTDGTQTQQQNFVLIGGHTSAAYINMSQVALFSLPQQGWTFVPVLQLDNASDEIEPRSGHSAALTPDGQHIVVFGGWVGDLNTPAEPQLAILNVGEGYGGQGSWEWTAPATSGARLPDGAGIYGHGTVMLPGGVMMVMGGYSISASSSRHRRATQTSNTETMFFNVSSSTWMSDYTPPLSATAPADKKSGPLAKTSQKAGLGVGLGVGMAAVLGLMVFYIWYVRRLKNQRELREKQLRDLAMGAHRYNVDGISPGIDGRGGQLDAGDYLDENDSYFYPVAPQNQGWRQTRGHDAERTGLLVEIPSPTRGLRRSLGGRQGHPLPRYDERRVQGSGHIHPIDEVEEEQDHENLTDQTPLATSNEMTERPTKRGASVFENAPVLDPFTDAHRTGNTSNQVKITAHSAPTSPVRDRPAHTPSDWQMATAGLLPPRRSSPNSTGRVSPTKSDRTGSNLSERSLRSDISSNSTNGSLRRNVSVRSAALMTLTSNTNPFKTPDASPTTDRANKTSHGWQSPVDPRTQSLTSIRSTRPGTANADAESFTTARTSFMQLQAEGEALLGGNPEKARPGTSSTSNGSNAYSYQNTEPSMSRNGTITAATSVADGPFRTRERRKSWLGSVRRALSRSTTTTDMERYRDDPQSPVAREDKRQSFPASVPPRRAASDASFWRSRRGRQDWLDEEIDPNDPKARWRRNSGDDWGAPEDLAHAEKERKRREWRERSTLINLGDDEHLPSPHTPIPPDHLGTPAPERRPATPADEEDWDVEAAVERRVVQVMFTVPKSRLRVVNADIDGSSIRSLPRDENSPSPGNGESSNSPGRVKGLVDRFEKERSPRQSQSPRASPRISPSPSIKSVRVRKRESQASLVSRGKGRKTSASFSAGAGAEESSPSGR